MKTLAAISTGIGFATLAVSLFMGAVPLGAAAAYGFALTLAMFVLCID